jgi:hypothetical protein
MNAYEFGILSAWNGNKMDNVVAAMNDITTPTSTSAEKLHMNRLESCMKHPE